MNTQFKTIYEYISAFPEDIQIILETMRHIIRKAAPEAIEVISYRMPGFKLNGSLVWFGLQHLKTILGSIQLLPVLKLSKMNYPLTKQVKERYSFR